MEKSADNCSLERLIVTWHTENDLYSVLSENARNPSFLRCATNASCNPCFEFFYFFLGTLYGAMVLYPSVDEA